MDEQRKNKEEICYQILLNERRVSIYGQSSSYIPLWINIYNLYVSNKYDVKIGISEM